MKKIINWTNKIEEKINIFFTWINKEPETPKEGILISLTALGIFIVFFIIVSLIGGLF